MVGHLCQVIKGGIVIKQQYLEFSVDHQQIQRTDDHFVVGASKNYLRARFRFSEDWDGEQPVAIFLGADEPKGQHLINGECEVPWEVLRCKWFKVCCVAGDLITTNAVTVPVHQEGAADEFETPSVPSPSVIDAKIAAAMERWAAEHPGGTGGITQETDPTVPAWAKQPQKPSYTAAEVGALPATTPIPNVPQTLPNPCALKFTGAAEGSYDGSKAVTVNIPMGGGGDGWEFIGEFNVGKADVAEWIVDKYSDETPISLKQMYFEIDFKASASTTANTKVVLGNPASARPFNTNCAYAAKDWITTSGKVAESGMGVFVVCVPCGDEHFCTLALQQTSQYSPVWHIGRSEAGGGVLRQCVGGIAFKSANSSTGLIGANSTVKIWGVRM